MNWLKCLFLFIDIDYKAILLVMMMNNVGKPAEETKDVKVHLSFETIKKEKVPKSQLTGSHQ